MLGLRLSEFSCEQLNQDNILVSSVIREESCSCYAILPFVELLSRLAYHILVLLVAT